MLIRISRNSTKMLYAVVSPIQVLDYSFCLGQIKEDRISFRENDTSDQGEEYDAFLSLKC